MGVLLPEDQDPRVDVTRAGHDLIRGDRARDYGPPHDNIERIAQFWSSYFGEERLPGGMTSNDVCNLMNLVKIAREATSGGFYHRDSTVDTVGYAAIKEVLAEMTRDEFIDQMR